MAYLDFAASTPPRQVVREVMAQALEVEGNATSSHGAGRASLKLVEEAREQLCELLDCQPSELYFTSGGTEADNLAIKGLFEARHRANQELNVIAVSALEHPAVSEAAHFLEERGLAEVVVIPSTPAGVVDVAEALALLAPYKDRLALVSMMWANNELGTIQPAAELASHLAEWQVPMHSDAVQYIGGRRAEFAQSALSALTISGHKIGGPQGIGAFVLRRGVACVPQQVGGAQERGMRSGTLPTALIAGFGAAAAELTGLQLDEAPRIANYRDQVERIAKDLYPSAVVNGGAVNRIPGTASLTFPGIDATSLLISLDFDDVFCSAGSACASGSQKPSPSLQAIGLELELQRSTLRFSVGYATTVDDLAQFERALRHGLTVSQAVV